MPGQECSAMVFIAPGQPLQQRRFTLPDTLEPTAAICKIKMSTICGSDLHTITGRRQEPAPLILGHEIIGEIVALGDALKTDAFGDPLSIGDRVSWSIMAACGECFFCRRDLPQKCLSLKKYGHSCCNEPPHLTGGYAEYIYLFGGTAIYKIPDSLSDEIATPANCALSTVVNAVQVVGLSKSENVLIQGAGLLGLNLIALAVDAGAEKIFVTDIAESRLDLARQFGATHCINLKDCSAEDAVAHIRRETDGHGVDAAFEICGVKEVIPQAVEALRIGGRYLLTMVTPNSDMGIEANALTRKCLTITGIHNYHPKHLGMALRFLEKNAGKFPYDRLVGKTFPLSEINAAVESAATGKHVRVAVVNP